MNNLYLFEDVPLDNTYENTFLFESLDLQSSYYLSSYSHLELNSQSFIRKNFNINRGQFQVNGKIGDFLKYSYLMFQADEMNNKIIYGFINGVELLNPNVTIIYYEVDLIQTYLFDIEFNSTIVEKMHSPWNCLRGDLNNSNLETSFYNSFVPENFEVTRDTKTYVQDLISAIGSDISSSLFLYVTNTIASINIGNFKKFLITGAISSYASSYYYLECASATVANSYIDLYVEAGMGESVIGLVEVPIYLNPDTVYPTYTGENNMTQISKYFYQNGTVVTQTGLKTFTANSLKSFTNNGSIDDESLVPNFFDNWVTIGYPFRCLSLSNSTGEVEYPYELTNYASSLSFTITPVYGLNSYMIARPSTISPRGTSNYYPTYNGGDYSLISTSCINLPFSVNNALSDYNKSAELKQNSLLNTYYQEELNLRKDFVNNSTTAATQLISGNFVGSGATALNTVTNTPLDIAQAKLNTAYANSVYEVEKAIANSRSASVVNNSSAIPNADSIMTLNTHRQPAFILSISSLPVSTLQKIDAHISYFGLDLNREVDINNLMKLKEDNLLSFPRTHFTFMRCKSSITGFLNKSDIDDIKSIFNNGITLWRGSENGIIKSKIDINKFNYIIQNENRLYYNEAILRNNKTPLL